MDDLLSEFIAECRDMLGALAGEIVAWENDPDDRSRLDSIFRFVHTVKGNCGFFDFPRLEALSHAAEGVLDDVRAGRRRADAELVSAVLAIIDRISELVSAIESNNPFPAGTDTALINALEAGAEGSTEDEIETLPAVNGNGHAKPVAASRTVRLSVELLDRLMTNVSDMVLARNDLARHFRESQTNSMMDNSFARLTTIITDMREAVTRTRMQPIDGIFSALPRLVRDLSAELGKQAMLDLESGNVELDREMIELIRDPLIHIIRNAMGHGIETPAERRAAGKREIGLLTVTAHQSGNQILIEVADDGRGIDGTALAEKAVAAGVLDAAEAARLSQSERNALIFKAGISTASSVTAISGRGVGMDVVRSNVEQIGGVAQVDSTLGSGTRITLRVPMTLTIVSALTVSIEGQTFAILRSAIEEIVQIGKGAAKLSRIGGATLATIRSRRFPCVSLASILDLPSKLKQDERTLIVLRSTGGETYSLAVDRIHDHQELVIKPASPAIMATGLYAGTSLADDGSPILVLDTIGLAKVSGVKLLTSDRRTRKSGREAAQTNEGTRKALLFTSLDGHLRALPMSIVDRIEEAQADAVQVSADGLHVALGEKLLALAGVSDRTSLPTDFCFLRLSDGEREIAYAVAQVIEIISIKEEPVAAQVPGEIEGKVLVDGEPVALLDPHWLFSTFGGLPKLEKRPVCKLPGNDPWIQHLLRPFVEAAGYRVVDTDDEVEADLAFVLAEADVEPGEAAQIVRLRSKEEEAPGDPESIYRYDRASLMIALGTATARMAS